MQLSFVKAVNKDVKEQQLPNRSGSMSVAQPAYGFLGGDAIRIVVSHQPATGGIQLIEP